MDGSETGGARSDVVHANPYFSVRRTTRGGADWFSVDAADSAVMVAEDPVGHLVMVRGSRASGGLAESWELPGGFVDAGEDPQDAAVRELEEETGFKALDVRPFAVIAQIPAISAARCHVFTATTSAAGQARLGRGEDWSVELVSVSAVRDLVVGGFVSDALTLAVLGRWVLARGWPGGCGG